MRIRVQALACEKKEVFSRGSFFPGKKRPLPGTATPKPLTFKKGVKKKQKMPGNATPKPLAFKKCVFLLEKRPLPGTATPKTLALRIYGASIWIKSFEN